MSGAEFNDVTTPKPPFHLVLNPNPNKNIKLNLDNRFGEVLYNQFLNEAEQVKFLKSLSPAEQKLYQKQQANLQNLLHTIFIYNGIDFLHPSLLAKIDQIGHRANFEATSNPKYNNFNNVLMNGVVGALNAGFKRKKERKQNIDDNLFPFGQNPHNVNAYSGIKDVIPLKKMSEDHTTFQKTPLYDLLSNNFYSPLREMGKQQWDEMQEVLTIIDSAAGKLTNQFDPFTDNNIEQFTINSNHNDILENQELWENWDNKTSFNYLLGRWESIKKYYKGIRTFTGKAYDQYKINPLALTTSPETSSFYKDSEKQIRSVTANAFNTLATADFSEDIYEIKDYLEGEYQKLDEMMTFLDSNSNALTEKELEDLMELKNEKAEIESSFSEFDINLNELIDEKSQYSSNTWIENIGKNMDQAGYYFIYNLFFETAPNVIKELDLGFNLDNSLQGLFQQQTSSGYTNYINENIINTYLEQQEISANSLKIDNLEYGQKMFNFLNSENIINENGGLNTNKFDLENAEETFGIENFDEAARIRKILKTNILGTFSFDALDKTRVNNHYKENIKIILPSGEKTYLKDLFDGFKSSESSKESYTQGRKLYNTLMDMFETMTPTIGLEKYGKKQPKIIKKDDMYTLTVYPKSEWQEYTGNKGVDLLSAKETEIWETKTNEPLTLSFRSEKEALDFYNKIQEMILYLEPYLGSFDPLSDKEIPITDLSYQNGEITELPLRMLIDNVGDLSPNTNTIITQNSSDHAYSIDTLHHQPFFQTNHYKKTAHNIQTFAVKEVGKKMFSVSIMNIIKKQDHKRKRERWEEARKEFKDKEFHKKVDEYKKYKKRKAEEKNYKQRTENKKIRERNEKMDYTTKINKLKALQKSMDKAKKRIAKKNKSKKR